MSGSIRPLERDDLQRVVELYQRLMRSDASPAPPGLRAYFERTLFEHPWVDPEIPSLVYETDDDRILGFIGSHARRLRFDGRSIRLGISGQLVSQPDHKHLAVGARLMQRYLAGPQDLSITDGATSVVYEMWVRLGGHALHPQSTIWLRPLRQPSAPVSDRILAGEGRRRLRAVARPVLRMVDAAANRMVWPAPTAVSADAEELTAQGLIEHCEAMYGESRLRVDYDEDFLDWQFHEMESVRTRGTLVRRLLGDSDGALGWYVYYARPEGLSSVMAVAARKGAIGEVLDHLFADAWRRGAAVLEGRMEPELYEPLSQRRCLLHYGARALFHSRDPEIVSAMVLGRSALTRLDGEWWMGHHTEPFQN